MKKIVAALLIFLCFAIGTAKAASEFKQRELIHLYLNYPLEDWEKLTKANRDLIDNNLLIMVKDSMNNLIKESIDKGPKADDKLSEAFVFANLADYIGKLMRKDEQNRFYLARINERMGRIERTVDICNNIVMTDPKNIEVMLYLASLFENLKMYENAYMTYQKVLKIDKNNKIALFQTGALFLCLGKYSNAVDEFKKLLKVDPRNEVAKRYVEIYEGKIKSNTKIDEKKEKAINFFFLGEKLFDDNKFNDAAEQYSNAIEADPGFSKAYVYLGSALMNLKKYDSAIDVLNNAIKLEANDPEAYNILGLVYEKQYAFNPDIKLLDKAIECYSKAVSIDAKYWKAVDNLKNANEAKAAAEKKR
ncbi:MAG: tetratricopeptide repeat protein [Firmicutes bacterium]|nr:tetratricopeptide repeat protein [Bacillota bacterium]